MKQLSRFLTLLALLLSIMCSVIAVEDTSPFRMRVPHSVFLRPINKNGINKYLKFFKDLECGAIEDENGIVRLKSLKATVQRTTLFNNTFELVTLEESEYPLYALKTVNLTIDVFGRFADGSRGGIPFQAENCTFLIKFRLAPKTNDEELLKMNPLAKHFVLEGTEFLGNFEFYQDDLELIEWLTLDVQNKIIEAVHNRIKQKIMKVFKRFQTLEQKRVSEDGISVVYPLMKQVARYATHLKIEDRFVEIGIDPEPIAFYQVFRYAYIINQNPRWGMKKQDYNNTMQTITKRKAKVMKPIPTEFTEVPKGEDRVQFIMNQNFFNSFLYDLELYDNYISVNRMLQYFDSTRDLTRPFKLSLLKPAFPGVAAKFGEFRRFEFLFSFSYKKTKEQLTGLRLPGLEFDKNGNIRFTNALNVAFDVSNFSGKREIALEGSIEMKLKAKIDSGVEYWNNTAYDHRYLSVKEIELGQLRIVDWEGQQQHKIEAVIIGAANTALPKLPDMIPKVAFNISRIDNTPVMVCLDKIIANYTFRPDKKYAEGSFEVVEAIDFVWHKCHNFRQRKTGLIEVMDWFMYFMEQQIMLVEYRLPDLLRNINWGVREGRDILQAYDGDIKAMADQIMNGQIPSKDNAKKKSQKTTQQDNKEVNTEKKQAKGDNKDAQADKNKKSKVKDEL